MYAILYNMSQVNKNCYTKNQVIITDCWYHTGRENKVHFLKEENVIGLTDWLVFVTACQHKIGQSMPFCKVLALAVEDSQPGTLYKKTVTIQINMQWQTTGMPYLLKDKQCIQDMGKKQAGVQHLVCITTNPVIVFSMK